jgi:hypothetical protein
MSHNVMSPCDLVRGQLYFLPVPYVAKEMKQENRILVEKYRQVKSCTRQRCKQRDNVKMDIVEIGDVNWIVMALDWVQLHFALMVVS